MTEEERKIRIEATKEAVRQWLKEEKEKTHQTIGAWFVNALTVAIVGAGMYLMLWMKKRKG